MSDFLNKIIFGHRTVLDNKQFYVIAFGRLFTDADELEKVSEQLLSHSKILRVSQKGKSSVESEGEGGK